MGVALITGSSGLVGSEAVSFLSNSGLDVIGIDNNFRSYFFGKKASTNKNKIKLIKKFKEYKHYNYDIRNYTKLTSIFSKFKKNIRLIIHAAAQPSHDWAVKQPHVDFSINAVGTLNMLELTKLYCPDAVFIFVSTNKVYGDTPNKINLKEKNLRWDLEKNHKFYEGINESMTIDNSLHSLFGVSKCSGDLLVQEYGKNIGLKTGVFRAGCITGPQQSGAELHGFLNYLVKVNLSKSVYNIFGFKGKQVRDNIHSYDLVNCFWHFFNNPKKGEVYNIGGTRKNSCSILEAIEKVQKISNIDFKYIVNKESRVGDHKWYITDIKKFKADYKNFKFKYSLEKILEEIIDYSS